MQRLFYLLTILSIFFYSNTNIVLASDDPIFNLINETRSQYQLPALSANSNLDMSAETKACDMNNQNYWSHDDLSGHEFDWWIRQSGYQYSLVGENLAKDFSSDSEILSSWMGSPSHRNNILSPIFIDIGIGRCQNNVVLHLGKPKNSQITIGFYIRDIFNNWIDKNINNKI